MGRPHIEFIHRGGTAAHGPDDGAFAALDARILSEDDASGAYTAVVSVPRDFSGDLGGHDRRFELLCLRGELEIDGHPFRDGLLRGRPGVGEPEPGRGGAGRARAVMVEDVFRAGEPAGVNVIDTHERRPSPRPGRARGPRDQAAAGRRRARRLELDRCRRPGLSRGPRGDPSDRRGGVRAARRRAAWRARRDGRRRLFLATAERPPRADLLPLRTADLLPHEGRRPEHHLRGRPRLARARRDLPGASRSTRDPERCGPPPRRPA